MAGQGRLVDVDTGAVRPGHVLLQRTPAAVLFLGFGPQAARLRDLAFEDDAELDPAARRCRSLADAETPLSLLKRGASGAAFVAPANDDRSLRRLAVVEDLAKAGFDPNEPRIPKGDEHPGRWTRDGSDGEAETPVSLRPGHYIDELADFIEWIANARPEDETPIRREIKRLYYDVGDVQGGNALNAALSDTIDPGIPQSDRQAILDGISAYAIADPAEMGQFSAALAGTVLAAQAPALRGRPRAASPAAGPPAAAATAAAEEAAATAVRAERPSEVWNYGWAARGDAIHEAMGANLQRSWKTIDDFRDGVATSIKSIDLSARTYRDPKRLAARINKFVDWIVEYPGSELSDVRITAKEITSRRLQLVVPRGTATARQQSAITVSTLRAQTFGVKLVITPY